MLFMLTDNYRYATSTSDTSQPRRRHSARPDSGRRSGVVRYGSAIRRMRSPSHIDTVTVNDFTKYVGLANDVPHPPSKTEPPNVLRSASFTAGCVDNAAHMQLHSQSVKNMTNSRNLFENQLAVHQEKLLRDQQRCLTDFNQAIQQEIETDLQTESKTETAHNAERSNSVSSEDSLEATAPFSTTVPTSLSYDITRNNPNSNDRSLPEATSFATAAQVAVVQPNNSRPSSTSNQPLGTHEHHQQWNDSRLGYTSAKRETTPHTLDSYANDIYNMWRPATTPKPLATHEQKANFVATLRYTNSMPSNGFTNHLNKPVQNYGAFEPRVSEAQQFAHVTVASALNVTALNEDRVIDAVNEKSQSTLQLNKERHLYESAPDENAVLNNEENDFVVKNDSGMQLKNTEQHEESADSVEDVAEEKEDDAEEVKPEKKPIKGA